MEIVVAEGQAEDKLSLERMIPHWASAAEWWRRSTECPAPIPPSGCENVARLSLYFPAVELSAVDPSPEHVAGRVAVSESGAIDPWPRVPDEELGTRPWNLSCDSRRTSDGL
ncbi:hypothetical protein Mapa_017521 [Marchantia paleacea]|nr:hypothetical protein Mapa_017521 [Marchantia paleacea]